MKVNLLLDDKSHYSALVLALLGRFARSLLPCIRLARVEGCVGINQRHGVGSIRKRASIYSRPTGTSSVSYQLPKITHSILLIFCEGILRRLQTASSDRSYRLHFEEDVGVLSGRLEVHKPVQQPCH